MKRQLLAAALLAVVAVVLLVPAVPVVRADGFIVIPHPPWPRPRPWPRPHPVYMPLAVKYPQVQVFLQSVRDFLLIANFNHLIRENVHDRCSPNLCDTLIQIMTKKMGVTMKHVARLYCADKVVQCL